MAKQKKIFPEEMRTRIRAMRGSIKFDTGEKTFEEWMADMKREEKELEEAKFFRCTGKI